MHCRDQIEIIACLIILKSVWYLLKKLSLEFVENTFVGLNFYWFIMISSFFNVVICK